MLFVERRRFPDVRRMQHHVRECGRYGLSARKGARSAFLHATRQLDCPAVEVKKPESITAAGLIEPMRLIDELYREELREARAMPPEQKLLLGEELFVYACSITMAGIRNQFPEADESERRRILEQRLELQRKLEARA